MIDWKNVLSYVFCVAFSGLFAYYVNGKGGIFLMIALLAAAAVSVINVLIVRKKIGYSMERPENPQLRKGDTFRVGVSLVKNSPLPTPYIVVKLSSSPNVVNVSPEIIKAAVAANNKPSFLGADYKAEFSGKAWVKIQSVRITDYLGMISFEVPELSVGNEISAEFNVLPEIPMVNFSGELLKSSSDAAAVEDAEEDTGETARYGGGVPGYEHRTYIPGDPLKKVNWKLSSKRDIYMVRLDEKVSVTGQCMVLDLVSPTSAARQDLINNDLLVESCFSMLSTMLMQEIPCRCWFWLKGVWNGIEVSTEADLLEFQKFMGEYDFYSAHPERLPADLNNVKGSTASMIFTNDLDDRLVSECQSSGSTCFFVSVNDCVRLPCDDLWIVDSNYEFKRFS